MHFLVNFIIFVFFHPSIAMKMEVVAMQGQKLFDVGHSKPNIFEVSSTNTPIYILGSKQIEVFVNSTDFDLEFQNTPDGFSASTGYLYKIFKKVFVWFQPNTNEQKMGFHQMKNLSPYKSHYFKIVLHRGDLIESALITTTLKVFNLERCLCLLLGVLLFYNAKKLSRSLWFYYTSSTGVGILASALILIYILSRYLPKKSAAYSTLLGGWSLCAWLFSQMWSNLTSVLIQYYHLVLIYIFVSGFLSFIICYRYGPVSDPRSFNIIQWTIQMISLMLIYNGTQHYLASVTLICAILIHWFFSTMEIRSNWGSCTQRIKDIFKLKWAFGNSPAPRRLLSEEEYRLQGEFETKKALEELRKFCHSPECSPWKTLSRIETPKRFAKFIEGEDHVNEEEVTLYEEDMAALSSDEDLSNDDADAFISEDDDSFSLDNLRFGDFNKGMTSK